MIDTPWIIKTAAQQTAFVHITVPREEIQNVMGPGLAEVRAAVAAQGITTSGPWFTHHRRMDPKVFDFEICIPVAATIVPVGRVQPGNLPATTVARTIYRGPYEGLGMAWSEFEAWIKAQRHTAAENLWECYIAGPDVSSTPANWQTELNRPLLS
ncbi:MAG TPA: GyrI-like domain-containing protein [Pirellulales bacterium]|jgi:effector-binding domain-containing protein